MKILVHRLCSLALLLLLSFIAFDAPAVAQNQIADPSARPPDLLEKSRAKKKNTSPAASTTAASGYNFQVLYSFGATTTDGTAPMASLMEDTAGNLYGTTLFGGAHGAGTVFKLDTTGQETVLYTFCSVTNCTDGAYPAAGLIQDTAGNLYGTTGGYGATGGGGANGDGTVFKLDDTGQETVIYSFCSANNCIDGSMPLGGLMQDVAGNLYGPTAHGGATGNGTVFKVDTTGQETVIYSFWSASDPTDGTYPGAGLIQDAAGNLYGTTEYGGDNPNGDGTVFKVDATGNETVIYSFCSDPDCTDGALPLGGLVQDTAGNLYGTTEEGGSYGTVFKLTPPTQPGGNWAETVLYTFCSDSICSNGANPFAGLLQDAAGNLYGTTMSGGGYGSVGTVFRLAPPAQSGGNWTETLLYSFCSVTTGCASGSSPVAGLIRDAAGNLYGTASGGGAYAGGTVFKLILIQTPTLTVTPSPSSITSSQPLTVGVTVGGVNGDPAPTGTVTLASSSYTSPATTLASGGATINVPAGSLPFGTDTLTVSYSGDIIYQSATGTATVKVVPTSFTIAGAGVTVVPGATTGNTSTITVTPSGGFTGSVSVMAVITSKPSGAQDLPTLSFGATSPVAITSASAGTATLIVTTTAATSAALVRPARSRGRGPNPGAATLAFALLVGIGIRIPLRGRGWWTRLATLVLMAALSGAFVACSSNGGGSTNTGNPGTTPGTYTATVTGTSGNTTATSTVTLTVQ